MNFEEWLELIKPDLWEIYKKTDLEEPEPKWAYEQIGDTHIVTIDPLELKMFVGPHTGASIEFKNFINASFTWWEDYPTNRKPYPTSMLVYKEEIFSNKQPNGFWSGTYAGKGVPTPTFVIWNDGICSVVTTNDLTRVMHNIHLAVTIVQTNPEVSTQGYVPYVSWSSIDYKTRRIGIFYRAKDGKVLLVYSPSSTISEFRTIGIILKTDFGGALDSGGSANFKVNGENINTTSRWMSAGLYWE